MHPPLQCLPLVYHCLWPCTCCHLMALLHHSWLHSAAHLLVPIVTLSLFHHLWLHLAAHSLVPTIATFGMSLAPCLPLSLTSLWPYICHYCKGNPLPPDNPRSASDILRHYSTFCSRSSSHLRFRLSLAFTFRSRAMLACHVTWYLIRTDMYLLISVLFSYVHY